MFDLLDKLEATPNGRVVRAGGSLVVEGSSQAWAYAASVPLNGLGPAAIKGLVKLSDGSMSIGVLSKTQDRFLVEKSISITSDFVSLEIAVRELGESSAIILRTFNDGRAKPRLEIKHLTLQPQTVAPQEQLKVDPSTCPLGDRNLQQFPEQLPAGWEDPLEKRRSKWLVVSSGNDLRRSSAHLLTCDDATLLGHWETARAHGIPQPR